MCSTKLSAKPLAHIDIHTNITRTQCTGSRSSVLRSTGAQSCGAAQFSDFTNSESIVCSLINPVAPSDLLLKSSGLRRDFKCRRSPCGKCLVPSVLQTSVSFFVPSLLKRIHVMSSVSDYKVASMALGFSLGFGFLTVWEAIKQTRRNRSPLRSAYIYMIWGEILANVGIGILGYLFLNGIINPGYVPIYGKSVTRLNLSLIAFHSFSSSSSFGSLRSNSCCKSLSTELVSLPNLDKQSDD